MKKLPSNESRSIIYYVLIIFLMFVFIFLIYRIKEILKNILILVIISSIVSYILYPSVKYFENKSLSRQSSIIIVFSFLIIILFLIGLSIIPILITEINNLIEIIPEITSQANSNLTEFKIRFKDGLPKGLQDIIDNTIKQLEENLLNILDRILLNLFNMLTALFFILLIPILSYYTLNDFEKLKTLITKLTPKKYRYYYFELFEEIEKTLRRYIRGQLVVSAFVFLLTSIVLALLKIEYAVFLGIFAGITNIIPYFGPILGTIPPILIALVNGNNKVFLIIISLIAVQQLESGIISPKVMGKTIGIHPILVIMSLLIGGSMFGFWGIFLAIPFVAISKVCVNYYLKMNSKS